MLIACEGCALAGEQRLIMIEESTCPGSDPAHVDVYKVLAGVDANSPYSDRLHQLRQLTDGYPGHGDIGRQSLHVQGVARSTTQAFVVLRGPISRRDMDDVRLTVGFEVGLNYVEQVDELGAHPDALVVLDVPENLADLKIGFRLPPPAGWVIAAVVVNTDRLFGSRSI